MLSVIYFEIMLNLVTPTPITTLFSGYREVDRPIIGPDSLSQCTRWMSDILSTESGLALMVEEIDSEEKPAIGPAWSSPSPL
jgi:hypothetical protein